MDIISSSVVSAEEPEPVVSPGDTFPGDTLPAVTETPIVQFYKNRTIFITGATGFLGKVLVSRIVELWLELLLKHLHDLKAGDLVWILMVLLKVFNVNLA